MLTDTKLGVGDIVILKKYQKENHVIIGEMDKEVFEVIGIKTGHFRKVLKEDCLRLEISTIRYGKDR